MEVTVLDAQKAPANSIISISTGQVRRQTKMEMHKAFHVPHNGAAGPIKVDLLTQLTSQTLALNGIKDVYSVPVEGQDGSLSELKLQIKMTEHKKGEEEKTPSSPSRRLDTALKMRRYLDEHQLQQRVQSLLHEVLKKRPDDPYAFMVGQLKAEREMQATEAAKEEAAKPVVVPKAPAEPPSPNKAPRPQPKVKPAVAPGAVDEPKETKTEEAPKEEAKPEPATEEKAEEPKQETEELKEKAEEPEKMAEKPEADEAQAAEEEEEDDDDDDDVEDLPPPPPPDQLRKPRTSVSAEAHGQWNKKKDFTATIIPKTEEQKDRIKKTLKLCWMFDKLEEGALKIVIDAMQEKVVPAGVRIINQGDDGDHMFVIEDGELECYKKMSPTEPEKLVKTCKQGDVFGELALLYFCPRAASCQTKDKCTLWQLDRETFNAIVRDAAEKSEKAADYDGFQAPASKKPEEKPKEVEKAPEAPPAVPAAEPTSTVKESPTESITSWVIYYLCAHAADQLPPEAQKPQPLTEATFELQAKSALDIVYWNAAKADAAKVSAPSAPEPAASAAPVPAPEAPAKEEKIEAAAPAAAPPAELPAEPVAVPPTEPEAPFSTVAIAVLGGIYRSVVTTGVWPDENPRAGADTILGGVYTSISKK
eukprot:gnl/MRDRNA2_/MRDRNA2_35264_c0_seq1.p1 gnl/MRDRNA2_/MRDRNA2_35264_c0~~gnl/MRDRNA2_/MRDRNA2_35264_c0_seq1.p1  ORF type:complete len:646 (-),score=214.53 gnl/MRDRNA2_/MRDRNA2_35264_c0_seq1:35-1972(-)